MSSYAGMEVIEFIWFGGGCVWGRKQRRRHHDGMARLGLSWHIGTVVLCHLVRTFVLVIYIYFASQLKYSLGNVLGGGTCPQLGRPGGTMDGWHSLGLSWWDRSMNTGSDAPPCASLDPRPQSFHSWWVFLIFLWTHFQVSKTTILSTAVMNPPLCLLVFTVKTFQEIPCNSTWGADSLCSGLI